MRQKIAAGNWKMNLTISEARELSQTLSNQRIPNDVKVILGCPTPYLYVVSSLAAKNKKISIAAQNAHHKLSGAFTGETSLAMLKSMNIDHVILGHSERRQYNGETNALLRQKVDVALQEGFQVIFCCGEPLAIRKKKGQEAYVRKQLKESVMHLPVDLFSRLVIAYEPIWAIGTGLTATPNQAQAMHKFIRTEIEKKYSRKIAQSISILYGGSVKPKNAKELFAKKDVDGGLVGGASLKADSFLSIIRSF